MCRMLGIASRVPIPAAVLLEFRALSRVGKVPADFGCGPAAKSGHPDGWGIAATSAATEVYRRSGLDAATDAGYEKAVREVALLPAPVIAVAHVRRVLDPDLVGETHSMPFRRESGGSVHYFAWDGSIEKYGVGDGGTDARWVWEAFAELASPYTPPALTSTLAARRDAAQKAFPRRLSSLTAIVTDGHTLLAHRDGGTCPLYFTLHLGTSKDMSLISSQVLDAVPARWRLLRNGESVAVTAPAPK